MKVFLVVDDAPVVRRVASIVLEDLGFRVVGAENGIEALQRVKSFMPDAMMIDWDLVDMSGLEFLQEFKRLPGSGSTRIFYCTSQIAVSEMTRAKRMGADHFLLKPFDREILTYKIKESGLLSDGDVAA